MTQLADLVACQRGLLTRAQALAAAIPAGVIDDRVRTRRWAPVLPRVYLVRPCDDPDELRVRAALLWAGADAVLTGIAAAAWHGLVPDLPATVRVVVPRPRRQLLRPGLALVGRTLLPCDVTTLRGVRVTVGPLTLLDAAVDMGTAGSALVLRSGVTWPELAEVRHRAAGVAGAAWLLRDLRHRGLADRVRDHANGVVRRAS